MAPPGLIDLLVEVGLRPPAGASPPKLQGPRPAPPILAKRPRGRPKRKAPV